MAIGNILENFVKSLDREQLEIYAINQKKSVLGEINKQDLVIKDLKKELSYKQEEIEKIKSMYNELTENKKINEKALTVKVKATEIDEVKDIIASLIFMLEDTRIDRDIRKQYLESCKTLKEGYYVRIDK